MQASTGLQKKAARISPRSNSTSICVIPHPGHFHPVTSRNKQGTPYPVTDTKPAYAIPNIISNKNVANFLERTLIDFILQQTQVDNVQREDFKNQG